ncbi:MULTISPECIES: fatty acid metabolism transcriptional regulator FadR [unclassified Thalassotalea]|uniref:fatty acid metabolism transcriptional regulator FadR n=1 Tax=unclassified Thalassotalea TaxID=2614972 RepID=UPI0010819955|nr:MULTISPECIES: fatty acid metabolism transcriptional regulator FadR [unclassified Thalassotalea]NMP16782.1 fatty acid metabolism transcriptional regulator FadR [Thalassotalea sp. Y01]QBY05558.1 fatty acid metabolism transcriptional regulator FadR [Thalassotalea sp. HSM 43]
MIIKAQSPAGFAEQYIVESIWNGGFPPGSILPAERELSELIGVTRTTLREVLQRLARDGWLTIQHGKPTKVNNFWETCGLNILGRLAELDQEGIPDLVENLLSARTNISAIYIRGAIKNNPDKVIELLENAIDASDDGETFAEKDYQLHHDLALASNNPIYVLVLNGFKNLYSRLGGIYFANQNARQISIDFYKRLIELAKQGEFTESVYAVREHGLMQIPVWNEIKDQVLTELAQ